MLHVDIMYNSRATVALSLEFFLASGAACLEFKYNKVKKNIKKYKKNLTEKS